MRFYDADAGTIRIHGRDIRSYDPKSCGRIRHRHAERFYLPGFRPRKYRLRPAIDDELLDEATQIAQARPFIKSLTDEFDYKLNSKGTNLSGGQRQRIFLSRAFANNPRF